MAFIPMCSYLIMFLLPVKKSILFEYTYQAIQMSLTTLFLLLQPYSCLCHLFYLLCIFLKIMVGNVNKFSFNNGSLQKPNKIDHSKQINLFSAH